MFTLAHKKQNNLHKFLFNLSNSLDIINGDYYDMELTEQEAKSMGIINPNEGNILHTPIFTNGKGCYVYADTEAQIAGLWNENDEYLYFSTIGGVGGAGNNEIDYYLNNLNIHDLTVQSSLWIQTSEDYPWPTYTKYP